MSLVTTVEQASGVGNGAATTATRVGTFGAGGAEPYARALRRDDRELYLHGAGRAGNDSGASAMNLSRWNDHADPTDLSLIAASTGAMLDVGCGPGRMVRAAMRFGLVALGIDVSPTAIEIAREGGLTVLERSVFDRLPREGAWATVLLVDGNIGIGGDASHLLERCGQLIAPTGTIIVETDADPERDDSYHGTLIDMWGHASESFPWAEIGRNAVARRAALVGLRVDQTWVASGRAFSRLGRA